MAVTVFIYIILLQPESSRQIPQSCQTAPVGTIRNTEHGQSYNRSMADLNLSILRHLSIRSAWSDPYQLSTYQIAVLML